MIVDRNRCASTAHQRGAITMIGALMVVAIFTLILAVYLTYVRPSEQESQAYAFAAGIQEATTRIQERYGMDFQNGYHGLNARVARDEGLLPPSLASSIPGPLVIGRTPWGGTWSLSASSIGAVNGVETMYMLNIRGMPPRVCQRLAHALTPGATGAQFASGTWIKPIPAPPTPITPMPGGTFDALVADECSAGTETGRVFLVYYN